MNNTRKRILVADDSHEFRAILAEYLEGSNYEPVCVDNVASALDALKDEAGSGFDALILDFWLGDESCLPIVEHVTEAKLDLPVVVISGGGFNLSPEMIEAVSLIAGSVRFLHKPTSRTELLNTLDKFVRGGMGEA